MEIKLPVPYFNQVNNETRYHGSGSRQCCLTSNAMAAEYLLASRKLKTLAQRTAEWGLNEPESAYGKILDKYGDTTDHEANGLALKELGLESYFSTTLSITNLIASLKANVPPVIGLHYKSSGHIVTPVGCKIIFKSPGNSPMGMGKGIGEWDLNKSFFWVHDPYGIRAGIADYYEAVGGQSGRYDKYSFRIMGELWEIKNDGWGRIFTSIGGKPTGL